MIVCLWGRVWAPGERDRVLERVLVEAPRLALGSEVIWADARGLDAEVLARRMVACALEEGVCVSAGVGRTPLLAELAARRACSGAPECIAPETEAAFLGSQPLAVLALPEPLYLLLQNVGLETCGELAALEQEVVEVRFGSELLVYWRRIRGDDERRLFAPVPPEPLHAGIDFVEYEVTDPERLIFSVHSLLGGVCEELRRSGEHARSVKLTLSLADGGSWERVLRPARPTGSRTVWLRLARALFERITVSAAVTGLRVVVMGKEAARAVQGDLFDAGFATASAVDSALDRLQEAQGDVRAELAASQHPLAEQRSRWTARAAPDADAGRVVEEPGLPSQEPGSVTQSPQRPTRGEARPWQTGALEQHSGLTLQLLAQPREVLVETVRRRDHQVPVRFRDGQWKQLLTVAGPDRISGGRWEEPYAREYFRAVTVEGVLVWLFRDARAGNWYLHGWWD